MSKGLHRLSGTFSETRGMGLSTGLGRMGLSSSAANSSPSAGSSALPSSSSLNFPFAHFAPQGVHEMMKRTWWVTWSLLMWASYNTGRIPTIRADDARVTSELPDCADQQAWASNVLSLQALLLVQDRVLLLAQTEQQEIINEANAAAAQSGVAGDSTKMSPLANKTTLAPPEKLAELGRSFGLGAVPWQNASTALSTNGATSDTALKNELGTGNTGLPTTFSDYPQPTSSRAQVLQSMTAIDASLKEQISHIEKNPPPRWKGQTAATEMQQLEGIEEEMIAYLHLSTAIQLYTAWLTLHLSSAFQGASVSANLPPNGLQAAS